MQTSQKNQSIRVEVHELLKSQPGVPSHYSVIAAAMDEDPHKVNSTLVSLAESPANRVTRASRGMYVYNPPLVVGIPVPVPVPAQPTAPVPFADTAHPKVATKRRGGGPRTTYIRALVDGRHVVTVDGELYVATKIDV